MNNKTNEWEEELEKRFCGTYYHEESGYDSPPQDGKGNVITTDRGIKQGVIVSELKSFIQSELHRQKEEIKEMIEGMRKEEHATTLVMPIPGQPIYPKPGPTSYNQAIDDILTKLEE